MDPEHFDLLVVLTGKGVLRTQDFAFPCEQGQCWFLPANLKECHFIPMEPGSLIRAYVPNIPALRKELQGVAQGPAASTVFD